MPAAISTQVSPFVDTNWYGPKEVQKKEVEQVADSRQQLDKEQEKKAALAPEPKLKPDATASLSEQLRTQALKELSLVDKKLEQSGIDQNDITFRQQLQELQKQLFDAAPEEAQSVVQMPKVGVEGGAALPLKDSEQLSAHLEEAYEKLMTARKLDKGCFPDHLAQSKSVKDLRQQDDAIAMAIGANIGMVKAVQGTIRIHSEDTARRTKAIEQLNSLVQYMDKHGGDKFDWTNPADGQEADCFKMRELAGVARENGVIWECETGWNSKEDCDRYRRAISASTGVLQSKNKVEDLKMQQSVSVLTALLILATTMLTVMSKLGQEICRNSRGG